MTSPPVPYTRTAQRPRWDQLAVGVREAIEARLGDRVLTATGAGGGFTQGFASVLTTAGGARFFVKAAPLDSPTAQWYAREANITTALPDGVPAARLHWHEELAGYGVMCLDAVDGGHMPGLPWRAQELTAALDALARSAAALAPVPPDLAELVTQTFTEEMGGTLTMWVEVAEGRVPMPAAARSLAEHLPRLVAWERALLAHGEASSEVMHCDLRVDNVIIDAAGGAWFCDWNWPCRGPVYIDLVCLLLSASPDHDVDTLFHAHPVTRDAPADALDALLAGLAGFFAVAAEREFAPGSPFLRAHQAYYAELALDWLARRHGWRR